MTILTNVPPIEHLKRFLGQNERTSRDMDQFFTAVGYPGYRTDKVAWCAAAAGWALIQAGYRDAIMAIPRKHRLMARAWDVYEDTLKRHGIVRVGGPEVLREGRAQYGDVITYVRGGTTRDRSVLASGHIDFFTSVSGDYVYGIGGNESNAVKNGRSKIDNVLSVWRLPETPKVSWWADGSVDKFVEYVPKVLNHEGGFVIDKGGPTFRGITLSTYREHVNPNATVAELKRMSEETAIEIYRRGYWAPIQGDRLPRGVDYATLDFGINSGPWRASVELQKILGVDADGEIGPITLKAVIDYGDPGRLAAALCDRRLQFMRGLSNWNRNKNGWTRRVGEVRAHALVLAQRHVDEKPAPPKETEISQMITNFLIKGVRMLGSKAGIGAALIGQLTSLFGTAAGADPTVSDPIMGLSAHLSTLINALTAAVVGAAATKDNLPPTSDEVEAAKKEAERPAETTTADDDEAQIKSAVEKIMNGTAVKDVLDTLADVSVRVISGGRTESRADLILWGATLQKMASDEAAKRTDPA